ncbi:MAG: DUF1566 domain-containing protein, partial [Desulfobacteraceae bacterium]|nr:DUF1566 domain-containing protein [Desulfobacteraceae bacterium]
KKLHDDLKSKGMEPWLDKEKILPGQNWKILISKAIKECNYFLALLSTNSVSKNGFVRKELKIALEIYNNYSPEDVFIIPARINECEPVDERLQYLQWADLFPSYETGMEQILRVLLPEETAGNELPDEKQNQKQKERVIKTEKAPAEIKYPRRKDPVKVSKGEFIKVFGLDGNRRPLEYIPNEYKDNEDGTVTDYATGLMWQQSGSDGYINYKQAQKYIQELNSNRFAGYDDWRLPTIDELISLLEPEKKSGDLYIDPIFDTKQRWCWSSDIESSSVAWGVYFSFGNVDLYNLYNYYYVRGVRPRQ